MSKACNLTRHFRTTRTLLITAVVASSFLSIAEQADAGNRDVFDQFEKPPRSNLISRATEKTRKMTVLILISEIRTKFLLEHQRQVPQRKKVSATEVSRSRGRVPLGNVRLCHSRDLIILPQGVLH